MFTFMPPAFTVINQSGRVKMQALNYSPTSASPGALITVKRLLSHDKIALLVPENSFSELDNCMGRYFVTSLVCTVFN